MTVAAGYGRVSTGSQAKTGTSAKDQENRIKEKCKEQGWKLHKFYSDEGISGKTMKNRPGIQALIQDARDGKFDIVVFTKLDRIARNLRELLNVWELIQTELKLDLYCIDESLVQTKGKFAKIILALLGSFAEFEREIIKERTEGGRKIKWKQGSALIGQPPYGYKWNKDKKAYEEEPSQVHIYKRIVSLYLDQNYTLLGIANQLSREGVPTPSESRGLKRHSKRWNKQEVRKILRNPAYTGKADHNRFCYEDGRSKETGQEYKFAGKKLKPKEEWVQVRFPRLIDEERWNLIQHKIEVNKGKPKKRHKGQENHFLADSFLRCGECDSKMRKKFKPEPNGKNRYYYLCYWKSTTSGELEAVGRERCDLETVDAERIDRRIFYKVAEFISHPAQFAEQWLKDLNKEEIEQRIERLSQLEKRAESQTR